MQFIRHLFGELQAEFTVLLLLQSVKSLLVPQVFLVLSQYYSSCYGYCSQCKVPVVKVGLRMFNGSEDLEVQLSVKLGDRSDEAV